MMPWPTVEMKIRVEVASVERFHSDRQRGRARVCESMAAVGCLPILFGFRVKFGQLGCRMSMTYRDLQFETALRSKAPNWPVEPAEVWPSSRGVHKKQKTPRPREAWELEGCRDPAKPQIRPRTFDSGSIETGVVARQCESGD